MCVGYLPIGGSRGLLQRTLNLRLLSRLVGGFLVILLAVFNEKYFFSCSFKIPNQLENVQCNVRTGFRAQRLTMTGISPILK